MDVRHFALRQAATQERLFAIDSTRTVAVIRSAVLHRGSSVLVMSSSFPIQSSRCALTARFFSTASVALADVRLVYPFSVVEGVHVFFSLTGIPFRSKLPLRERDGRVGVTDGRIYDITVVCAYIAVSPMEPASS